MTLEAPISIVIKPESFALSKSNALTGEIFFVYENTAFPDSSWNDFVVVILAWWVEAIIRLGDGSSSEEDLLFMDGPFQVSISVESEDLWRIKCIENDTIIKQSGSVKPIQFVDTVMDAVDTTLAHCKENNWMPSDLDSLVQIRKSL